MKMLNRYQKTVAKNSVDGSKREAPLFSGEAAWGRSAFSRVCEDWRWVRWKADRPSGSFMWRVVLFWKNIDRMPKCQWQDSAGLAEPCDVATKRAGRGSRGRRLVGGFRKVLGNVALVDYTAGLAGWPAVCK